MQLVQQFYSVSILLVIESNLQPMNLPEPPIKFQHLGLLMAQALQCYMSLLNQKAQLVFIFSIRQVR